MGMQAHQAGFVMLLLLYAQSRPLIAGYFDTAVPFKQEILPNSLLAASPGAQQWPEWLGFHKESGLCTARVQETV